MKALKNLQIQLKKDATHLIFPSIIVVLFSALGFTLSLAINDLFLQIKKKYVKEHTITANIIYIVIVFSIIIVAILLLKFFHIKVKNPLIK